MIVLVLALLLGAPQGRSLSGPELDQRTQEVASLLRCPVCQGMSVADSPSTVALDMKHQVREWRCSAICMLSPSCKRFRSRLFLPRS